MPWCPKCKNEYREGISVCSECGIALVESLENEKEQEKEDIPVDFRAAAGDTENTEDAESIEDIRDDEEPEIRYYHAYRDSADQAEDNRSSAHMLLVIGGIGFVLVLLIFLGIIPLFQNEVTTKYMICGVMGAMFVLFIVFGFVSMKSSKILSVKAKTEDSLFSEITKWCGENLNAAKVDEGLFDDETLSEEQKYFMRVEKMKTLIGDKFMNLDEAFLEHFIDEYYQKLFDDAS